MAKKKFKAETERLMDLMINSIYSHKEIFLREIVSNASDAIDKMNYRMMTDPSIGVSKDGLRIDVAVDKEKRTVTVSDNGIGMSAKEMEKNLGMIAYSDSSEFRKNLEEGADSDVIGKFGVGFYSAFMVSDKVTVVSKAYGEDQASVWESVGTDGYTIRKGERDSAGTDVIMHIKNDAGENDYSEFLDPVRLRELIVNYSDYIRWPIYMDVETGEWKETGDKEDDGEPKREYVTTVQNKVINSMVPIWQKDKNDVSDEDCKEFYKQEFYDYEDPVSVIRVKAEGRVSYKAMLFIPKRAPHDFYTRDFQPGLQLYSSGVLIMEKCADLLPYYLRFVRGVVDSPDFSLNISREMLQNDGTLKAVGSNLAKKVRSELERMMKDEPEKYREFYGSFGLQLKYGVVDNYGADKDVLKDLLMFESSAGGMTGLSDYVKNMPEKQDKIYFIVSDSAEHAKSLPQMEPVLEKGYGVLLMTDDVDSFLVNILGEYEGKHFCNVSTDDLGLESEEEKKESEEKEEGHKDTLDFVKETLGESVSEVRISRKLKNHAVLLTTKGGITFEMEKYFKSLPGGEGETLKASRVIELNAEHGFFRSLEETIGTDKERAAKMVRIMYGQASITAGVPLEDPVAYSDLVLSMF
jgi:molecular chaperone HtpG